MGGYLVDFILWYIQESGNIVAYSLIPRPLIQCVYHLQYWSDPRWGWFGSGTETK